MAFHERPRRECALIVALPACVRGRTTSNAIRDEPPLFMTSLVAVRARDMSDPSPLPPDPFPPTEPPIPMPPPEPPFPDPEPADPSPPPIPEPEPV